MKIWLGKRLVRLLAWLPLSGIRGLAVVLGWLVWLTPGPWLKRQKRQIELNLSTAFPELDVQELKRLQRQNLIEMFSTMLEIGPIWYRSGEWIQRRFKRSGWHHLERAQQRGKGVLMISGHLGNWEAGIMYVTQLLPLVYLYKPPRSNELDEFLTARRSRFGGEFAAAGSAAMRRLVRQLRQGGVAGLLFDQRPKGGDSVQAPFFNRTVDTMTLVHQLSARTGCSVLFADVRRRPARRGWEVRIGPLHEDFSSLTPAQAAALLNAELERRIREVPAQYLWQYPRFERGG